MKKLKNYITAPAKLKTDDIFERAQIDLTFDLTIGFVILYILMLVGTANLETSLAYDIVNYSSFGGLIASVIVLRASASYFWAGVIFWLTGFLTSNSMVLLAAGNADLQFGVWHSFSIVIAFSLLGKKWGLANAIYLISLTVLIVLNHLNDWNLFDIGLDRGPDIDQDPVPVAIPMVATAYIMFQTIRTRKKAQDVMSEQKDKETSQRIQLEQRNLEILDSINYAKRIQSAILPSKKLIREHLPNSFVLYKPKDIVAGDFYWMEAQENRTIIAAADCTGHGVPGALVSVICNNGLNRSVREYGLTDPGLILDKTREVVIAEFEKSEEEVQDGMDVAVVSLEFESESESESPQNSNSKLKLNYSGAHNPLWIIRKDAKEISEIKANKQPIGKFDRPQPYTTHTIELNQGDTFYIFSDGYADQFGGEKGKKFKAANFKKLLLSIQQESMERQGELLEQAFENWKGSLEQLDDVCVIGVRV